MISIIVALARNGAIGRDNGLLYHLPADLRRFKELTTGHPIVMGRRTFESFPKGALPNRRNIVISHDTSLTLPGAEVYNTPEAALEACAGEEDVFIIGGGSIYRQFLPLADRLCLTLIDATPVDADTFFPAISTDEWEITAIDPHPADDRHSVPYLFIDCIRKASR